MSKGKAGVCDNPRPGLGCDLLLGCCLVGLGRRCGPGSLDGRGLLRLLGVAVLLGLGWDEDGFGFGEEVEFVLARDADVSGRGQGEAQKRVSLSSAVLSMVESRTSSCAALFVLVGDVFG